MSYTESFDQYLNLANSLFNEGIPKSDLPRAIAKLPPINKTLLSKLADEAEKLALTEPRRGWAVAQIADMAASSQQADLLLQSLAAWYLARACNHWTQPTLVNAAVTRARAGFEELGEIGWLAACDWQLNAQPWTRPFFTDSIHSLQDTLKKLERAGFDEFIPHCRLALAYAQLLTGNHKAAMKNIAVSEKTFVAAEDRLNQARCWLSSASSLRRQGRFDAALDKLQGAFDVLSNTIAPVELAKTHYQIALCHSLKADRLSDSRLHFEKAAQIFRSLDLDLWLGVCLCNLGLAFLLNGQLRLADENYKEAREIFDRHGIPGLVADNLNDMGKLNILLGKPSLSVEQFKQSELINEQIGSQLQAAIAITNLGDAYGQLGRYQDALYHLERAILRLKPLKNYFRLATCEKYIALVWTQLGQPMAAHEHLDQAAIHYKKAHQRAFLASILNYRASIFFHQGNENGAIECIQQAMKIAAQYDMQPQIALAKRLLGEVFLRSGRTEDASVYLEQSRTDCIAMGMLMEQAACMIAIGTRYRLTADYTRAKEAFEEALQLSEENFPETDWRAQIELGGLAESQGNIFAALGHYRLGVDAFRRIRQNLLQPTLAGSYLQAPASIFDRIINTAAAHATPHETLYFIEAGKASTLLRHLSANVSWNGDTQAQELDELRAEIHALQDQLRASMNEATSIRTPLQNREARTWLIGKMRKYDELKARLERQNLSEKLTHHNEHGFELSLFLENASRALGKNWVALAYYLSDKVLTIVVLTAVECQIVQRSVSQRLIMALEACERARRKAEPPHESDLKILGDTLIPDSLAGQLAADTHLLIIPHRRLHHIPWPALRTKFTSDPLICICTPSIHPSLQCLTLLWERAYAGHTSSGKAPKRNTGLLMGLSTFKKDGREDLPQVREELLALQAKLDNDGRVLSEENATWENLLKLKNEENPVGEGLSRFAWLHIASHFFSDRHTGRLSSIALADGDIWLDQLLDLAPLPELITLSACSSNDSFLYEGDEHVDLQSTCFIAGASSVIGNAWPIPDRAAGELIIRFYDGYLSGLGPAQAVAQAQRAVFRSGAAVGDWASFMCAGKP